jgi:hypothetical protein
MMRIEETEAKNGNDCAVTAAKKCVEKAELFRSDPNQLPVIQLLCLLG